MLRSDLMVDMVDDSGLLWRRRRRSALGRARRGLYQLRRAGLVAGVDQAKIGEAAHQGEQRHRLDLVVRQGPLAAVAIDHGSSNQIEFRLAAKEERDRGEVEQVLAKARVVEIDQPDLGAVGWDIVQVEICMDQPVDLGRWP